MDKISFLSPFFLSGLGLVLVPIILHFINRKISKKIVFPTIRFIHQAQQIKSGKKQIRDKFLLLIRILILTLIVLIFSKPIILGKIPIADTTDTKIVLFIDLSVSMHTNSFNEYLKKGADEIFSANPDASYALLASSNKIEESLPFETKHEKIRDKIDLLKPTLLAGNHHDALSTLPSFFDSEGISKKIVYIFSDLQHYDWNHSRLPSLNLNTEIVVVKPEHINTTNVTIRNAVSELYVKDSVKKLRATIETHFFSVASASAKLKLTVGTKSVVKNIELRGGYNDKFIIDLDDPDSDTGMAEVLFDDDLQVDNTFFFWVGSGIPLKVAIVVDYRDEPAKKTESFFLINALSVTLPGMTKFDIRLVDPDFIWDQNLSELQGIFFLDSLTTYTESELEMLFSYLSEGGNVIYFSGKKSAQNIAKLFNSKLGQTRFNGFKGEINQLRSFTVDALDLDAPVLSIFREEKGDLNYFPIYKYSKFVPHKNSKTLLTFSTHDPFLIQESISKGSLFMFATSLSPQWSEFPTSMTFLPLTRHIVNYGQSENRGILTLTIGEDYAQKLNKMGLADEFQIKDEPGVFTLKNIPVELNINRMESDFTTTQEYKILSRLSSLKPGTSKANTHPESLNVTTSFESLLAALLILIFLLELIFANYKFKTNQITP